MPDGFVVGGGGLPAGLVVGGLGGLVGAVVGLPDLVPAVDLLPVAAAPAPLPAEAVDVLLRVAAAFGLLPNASRPRPAPANAMTPDKNRADRSFISPLLD